MFTVSEIMEEPLFIKCEPKRLSDLGKPPFEMKIEPADVIHNPSRGEDAVKEELEFEETFLKELEMKQDTKQFVLEDKNTHPGLYGNEVETEDGRIVESPQSNVEQIPYSTTSPSIATSAASTRKNYHCEVLSESVRKPKLTKKTQFNPFRV